MKLWKKLLQIFKPNKVREIKRPTHAIQYPTGICVETENNWYFIKSNYKIRITSERILSSWKFNAVVPSSEAALINYKLFPKPLGFRQGSLLKNIADGKLYLISDNKRLHVKNPDHLNNLMLFEHIDVSDNEINYHEEGESLD